MTTMTTDGLLTVADILGVQTLPTALAAWPRHDTYAELRAAREQVRRELTAARIIDDYGDIAPELSTALWALSQPEVELAARIITDNVRVQVCVVRRSDQHALAVRRGDEYTIQPITTSGTGTELAKPLLAELGSCPPAQVGSVSAPAAEISERLTAAHSSADFTDVMYRLGADDRDAAGYGAALANCHGLAEVVAYNHADGASTRAPGAVVVYDTAHGRIVSTPTVSPDARSWCTVTTGTDHRIAQALTGLIESLPEGRWLPR